MAKKLFVGSLPWSVTQEQLTELFSQAGAVESVQLITDKFSGKSRGFAFVEMADEAADKAIEMFNGYQIEGRAIVVNEARPREDRPARSGGFNRGNRSYGQRDRY